MQLVLAPQEVRTAGARPPCLTPRPPVRSAPACLPVRGRTKPGVARTQAAGWRPARGRVVDKRRALTRAARGTPTGGTRRKAAVRAAGWRGARTPPGSEHGACGPRESAGTWASHRSPCGRPGMGDRVTPSPGVAWVRPPGHEPTTDPTHGGRPHGIGGRATSQEPRDGEGAVVAAQRTEAGGAVRRQRPTGGKATGGQRLRWPETGESRGAPQP